MLTEYCESDEAQEMQPEVEPELKLALDAAEFQFRFEVILIMQIYLTIVASILLITSVIKCCRNWRKRIVGESLRIQYNNEEYSSSNCSAEAPLKFGLSDSNLLVVPNPKQQ